MKAEDLNLEKKEIIDSLYLYTDIDEILTGSLQEVANNILALENRLRTECEKVVRNPDKYIRFNVGFYEGFSESYSSLNLYGVRMETDEEFEKRIYKNKKEQIVREIAEKKRKDNKEKSELATFLRLQKKFGEKTNKK